MKDFNIKKSSLISEIIQSNEVGANRFISVITLCFAAFEALILVSYKLGYIELGYDYTIVLTLVSLTLLLIAGIWGLATKMERTWIKWVLLITYILASCLIFFTYGHYLHFFILLAIPVSARYFKLRFTISIAIINFICYLITCFANYILDPLVHDIYMQHRASGTILWADLGDMFFYEIQLRTLQFAFVTFLAISIVKTGVTINKESSKLIKQMDSINAELALSAQIQQSILPAQSLKTRDGGIQLNATMKPAKEVAGDFYDYFILDKNHVVILVADVSDKGLPAAMFMMSAKSEIRSAVFATKDLQTALVKVNKRLIANNTLDMFVTLWIGNIDIRTGLCSYINAGHTSPLIQHNDGTTRWVTNAPDKFLGVFENYKPHVNEFYIHKGDTLIIYTDGITDCENTNHSMFGKDRLYDIVNNNVASPNELCSNIISACSDFSKDTIQFDDMTLLTIKFDEEVQFNDTLVMDANTDSIVTILDTMNKELNNVRCPEDVRRKIEIGVDEICSNVVAYAYDTPNGKLEVRYNISHHKMTMLIADNGKQFNPLEYKDPDITSISENGGLGIFIAKKIMDNMSYTYCNGRNCLTISKSWAAD